MAMCQKHKTLRHEGQIRSLSDCISLLAMSSKKVPFSMCKLCRFTSSCTCVKFHPGICCLLKPLRKHAYSNILKISPPKTEKFSDKIQIFFIFLRKTKLVGTRLELPRQGNSNKYPQSMSLNGNKKNNVYPCKPQFYYIKVGFKGGQNYIGMIS